MRVVRVIARFRFSLRTATLLGLVLFLLSTGPAQGQETDSLTYGIDGLTAAATAPRVTLAEWAAGRRRWVLNRSHAYGDQFYDRGVFRHITPFMDREYAIDVATYQFTPGMDNAWWQMPSGIRVRTGSITRNRWGIVTQIKHGAEVAEGHTLRVDATLQDDGQADRRALVELRYDWAFAPGHHVGLRHTFVQYKPDFDISAFYQYGDFRHGRIRAEVTALDAYNDFLFDVLGVWKGREEYVRVYRQNPYLAQLTMVSPTQYPLRGELHLGWQPPSELVVQSQINDDERYRDREATHYLGAMVSYDLGGLTAGLVYQRDESSLDRQGLRAGVTSDYRTEQRYERAGLFTTGVWGPVRGSAWLFLEDYYDRQEGTDFRLSTVDQSMDWQEGRTNYQFRLYYVPEATGVFVGLEYIGLDRRPVDPEGVMADQWATGWAGRGVSHYRGPIILGYRFGEGAVSMGINWDFDADQKGDRFDNGFFRFLWAW